jgi:hypothetical protein
MTPRPLLLRFAIASAVCAPLLGQTPLFTDGTAFGGSKVFSEGMNPLGNPARYAQAPSGWYFSFVDGDQEAKDCESNLSSAASQDPVAASNALGNLANGPWAQRTRAYGLQNIKKGASLALTREECNGLVAYPDLSPSHLGSQSALGLNTSTLQGRRAVVNRLSLGGGGPLQQGSTTALGLSLRVERWSDNELAEVYNAAGPGAPAFGSAAADLLGGHATSARGWNFGLDAGAVLELTQGVRLGLTAYQLNEKHLWGVDLQPQFRAGLQLDLGSSASVALEGDLNSAQRMPFAVKQQSNSASLRYAISGSAIVILGVEQRKLGADSVTRGGATLQIRTESLLLALGFQLGQDRPLKSASLMVD